MRWSGPWVPYALVGGLALVLVVDLASGRLLNQLFLAMPGIDKVGHVVFFGALFACVRHVAAAAGVSPRWHTATAAGASLLFGSILEVLQGVADSGSMDGADLVADASGIALAWVAVVRPPALTAVGATAAALAAAGIVTYQTYAGLVDYARAQRYLREGDQVRALASLHRALEAGFKGPGLYNDLAYTEVESGVGDPRRGVEYARIAREMQPANADILDTYGWALHNAGRSAEALAPLLDAYARKPRMYCIHYHLGAVYLALGRRADAVTHFQQQLSFTGTREATLARSALASMTVQP
jgi:Tfp pilus assembly protein PilF